MDATFTLTGTAVDGEYTVRTVFVTDATVEGIDDTLLRADKLVKLPGETVFKWCDDTGCNADRDTVPNPHTDSVLKNYQHPGQGNVNYPPYAITLKETLTVTHAQIASPTNVCTLDFDLTDAIEFKAAPNTFASQEDVVENFALKYAPNSTSSAGNPDDGIRATLTIGD